jgi:hypothetical protein
MPQSEITRDELVALFAVKATAPPSEANLLLVRHLKCKESVHLAGVVSEAMTQYTESNSQRLHVPSQLLPPLG